MINDQFSVEVTNEEGNTMKVTFKSQESNAINYGGKKELTESLKTVAYKDGRFYIVVDARFYSGRSAGASTVYCAIWVHGDHFYTSGRGNAGGYGYHKTSAALSDACKSAGIEIEKNGKYWYFHGCGDRAMREAVSVITEALGYDTYIVIGG